MTYDGHKLYKEIQDIAQSLLGEIITLRHHLHQHPELSWQEYETAAHLAMLLRSEEIEITEGICKTGLTAKIQGVKPGPNIAIRADMDALPMQDAKTVHYASKVAGAIHACGHDCHMAMAIGVAKVLKRLNLELPGSVKFIFQPCEESVPSGASELVKAGTMDGVDAILAFHVDPELHAGTIGLRSGTLTAHCTEFNITLRGKSGHAARPHQAIDTIYLANQVMTLLYDIVGSRSQPLIPAVLTIGKFAGGTKSNIIAETVELGGTVRTIDEQSNHEILTAIAKRAKHAVEAGGGKCEVEFLAPVPSVYNHHGLVSMVDQLAREILPGENIVNIEKVSMGGEDFSWYLTKAPGALIRLGAKKANSQITHLHTTHFDIDEAALPFGVSLMTMLVLKYLFQDQLSFKRN